MANVWTSMEDECLDTHRTNVWTPIRERMSSERLDIHRMMANVWTSVDECLGRMSGMSEGMSGHPSDDRECLDTHPTKMANVSNVWTPIE